MTKRNQIYLPLRRVELALNRIIDTAIPFHLENLEKHGHRIQTFRNNEEWDQLLKEQINASQTVQQLKADLTGIESLREQVMEEDIDIIDLKIIPIKSKVCDSVQQFIELHKDLLNPLTDVSVDNRNSWHESSDESVKYGEMSANLEIRAQISEQKSNLISWQNLKKELNDLNGVINSFASAVMGQKEGVNRIENNINHAHQQVFTGTVHLSRAAALKSSLVPITGALVGGAVCGPIGMIAGFKLGLVSALGGSILGYSGLKIFQNKSIANNEIELDSLSNQSSDKKTD